MAKHAVLLGLGLLACAGPSFSAERVYPRDAEGLAPIELSRLIAVALPSDGRGIDGWKALRSDRRLRWGARNPDVPYPESNAYVRVRAGGNALYTDVHSRRGEIAWILTLKEWPALGGSVGSGFSIRPDETECYGKGKPSCVFSISAVLRSAPFKAGRLCRHELIGDNWAAAYQIVMAGKQDAVLVYSRNSGSAIDDAWVEIQLNRSPAEVCADVREENPRPDPRLPPAPPDPLPLR
jgi:hypothetical protein